MNQILPEDWIRTRAAIAADATEPSVDVSERVLATVGRYTTSLPELDRTPLFVGGGLLALAASVMLLLLPSLTLFTEPWISFWLI